MSNPHLNLQTTSQILKQSSTSFLSNLTTFIFLSLTLLSFRSSVETGTLIITTFIDRDPSLKSLISRLDLPDKPFEPLPNRRHHHHRPFLHLTRVGTLDDDFFSTEEDDDRNLFKLNHISKLNLSYPNLNNFNKFSEISSSKFHFQIPRNETEKKVYLSEEEDVFKRLSLARRDASALFFLVSFLSTAYGWMILGYLVMYSCVLGVVFVTVVNTLLKKYNSFVRKVWDGSHLGFRRLSGVLLIRWAVRDALTQVLGFWYFGEIEDQYSFLKLFVRLKLMPFSVMSPWIRGFDKEISGFLFAWFLLDSFVAFVFALDCWVAIVDSRMSSKEVVREGCYLISFMLTEAVQLKFCEALLCGSPVRWVLTRVFGNVFALTFQSLVEVYFMVVWLVFYFAVRCKDANLGGTRFGRRDLEDYVNHVR